MNCTRVLVLTLSILSALTIFTSAETVKYEGTTTVVASGITSSLRCDLQAYRQLNIPVRFEVEVELLYPKKEYPASGSNPTLVKWPSFKLEPDFSTTDDWVRPYWYEDPRQTTSDTTVADGSRYPSKFIYQLTATETFRINFRNGGVWRVKYAASYDKPSEGVLYKPKGEVELISRPGNRVEVIVVQEENNEKKVLIDKDDLKTGGWVLEYRVRPRDAGPDSLPRIWFEQE